MRLLNIHTLDFQEFEVKNTPPYVITSHRWHGGEITYRQFCNREVDPEVTKTPGYKKVLSFCEFMRAWGKDLSCPSRESSPPNSKGDCGSCFSKKFECDQEKPRCSNCRHDDLPCGYDIPKIIEPTPKDGGEHPQKDGKESNKPPKSNKSCKACATSNQSCGKQLPSCGLCERKGIICDYDTALTTTVTSEKDRAKITELEWIWIDTCCIDKTSSTELIEAVNSMFNWYLGAYACLAYLQDVRPQTYAPGTILLDFCKTSWFTRGWTLQELLAPSLVVFLNQDWEVFGHKAGPDQISPQLSVDKIQMPLNPWISRITGIREDILHDYKKMKDLSIEARLGWMKDRNTTRTEDRAYCLLGICDVFMPLIYGEGEKACDRLQDIINKESTGIAKKVSNLRKRLMTQDNRSEDDFDLDDPLGLSIGVKVTPKTLETDRSRIDRMLSGKKRSRSPKKPKKSRSYDDFLFNDSDMGVQADDPLSRRRSQFAETGSLSQPVTHQAYPPLPPPMQPYPPTVQPLQPPVNPFQPDPSILPPDLASSRLPPPSSRVPYIDRARFDSRRHPKRRLSTRFGPLSNVATDNSSMSSDDMLTPPRLRRHGRPRTRRSAYHDRDSSGSPLALDDFPGQHSRKHKSKETRHITEKDVKLSHLEGRIDQLQASLEAKVKLKPGAPNAPVRTHQELATSTLLPGSISSQPSAPVSSLGGCCHCAVDPRRCHDNLDRTRQIVDNALAANNPLQTSMAAGYVPFENPQATSTSFASSRMLPGAFHSGLWQASNPFQQTAASFAYPPWYHQSLWDKPPHAVAGYNRSPEAAEKKSQVQSCSMM